MILPSFLKHDYVTSVADFGHRHENFVHVNNLHVHRLGVPVAATFGVKCVDRVSSFDHLQFQYDGFNKIKLNDKF